MKDYIHLYPNKEAEEMNYEFLRSENDIPIPDLIIMCMKEFEAIENVDIESYRVVWDQDDVDYNEHVININYKKKRQEDIKIPKYKYITDNRFGEIIFDIRIHTNLNEKKIKKKILFPIEYDGFYTLNSKKWKSIWQLVDGSTYAQKGKITQKSRMPIIIYHSKRRAVKDIHETEYMYSAYSYALDVRSRHRKSKKTTKYINPFMIFSAKIGLKNAIDYFGFKEIISIETKVKKDEDIYRYFPLNELYIKVPINIVDNHKIVQSMIGMLYGLQSTEFPVTKNCLTDKNYWICRIGSVGSGKNKNLQTFYEKGNTTLFMIERLLDNITINNLRLPDLFKNNIYALLRWMILDFDTLKGRNTTDLSYKRVRKNEYIVLSSLGKKISENINKLIEKRSKSKLNTMDTLLELFNFGSDIIIVGMRNINDLLKSDELVNDLTFLQDIAYSTKGPNSLGENANKKVSIKYRDINPSFVGRIDLSTSSNSDVGMSGSFTPFIKLYDNFYFKPEGEPHDGRFKVDKIKHEFYESGNQEIMFGYIPVEFENETEYLEYLDKHDKKFKGLKYEVIEIVEKEEEDVPNGQNINI